MFHQLTFVSVAYIPEGLPVPVTKPTQFWFGLWVISGIAIIKVLGLLSNRHISFDGQCDHGKLW